MLRALRSPRDRARTCLAPPILLVLMAAGCHSLREQPLVTDGAAPDRAGDPFPDPVPVPTTDGPPADLPPDRAPPADAPPAGGGESRCPASFAICDGFEKPELDPGVFGGFSTPGSSSFSIDSTRWYRGSRSLRLHVEAQTKEPVGVGSGPLSDMALPNPVYVRFFLFLPADVPRFNSAFVTVDDPQGLWVDWTDHDVTLAGEMASEKTVPGVIAHGRWVCMLVKARTGTDSELSLFVDGSATPAATTTPNLAQVYHRVMFAIDPDGSQARPVDVWIDEVLVSSTPVGCDD